MGRRLTLDAVLRGILNEYTGAEHLYYQPPESIQLAYPCIVYSRPNIEADHADDRPYILTERFEVTVIDGDPDSAIPEAIAKLPRCKHDRRFVYDNLYHDVFTIYY
jgi:hypothetical protein